MEHWRGGSGFIVGLRDRRARAAFGINAGELPGIARKQNDAAAIPRAAGAQTGLAAQDLRRPSRRRHDLEFSLNEEADEAAVRRPERRTSADRAGEGLQLSRVER